MNFNSTLQIISARLIRLVRRGAIVLAFTFGSAAANAAPGDILFSDDFESGFGQWTTSDSNLSGVSSATSSSASNSLFLRGDTVRTTSSVIDTQGTGIQIRMWVRRGSDSFSEDTDITDDFVLEFLDVDGFWIPIRTVLGNGTPGEVFLVNETRAGAALHSLFQLRVRLTSGSGGPPENGGIGWDYWHVDDVSVLVAKAPTALQVGACEEFDSGLGGWIVAPTYGQAMIGSQTSNTSPSSLSLNGGIVSVTSLPIGLGGTSNLQLSLWIRRGDDSFSELPDIGENLMIEFLDRTGAWIELGRFYGNGTGGQVYTPNFTLPNSAAHAKFRIRVRMTGEDGINWDYWHVDSICLTGESVVANWQFEEASWNGTTDEVLDESQNGHLGTAISGTSTAFSDPAIPGDPGTCGYAVFDGVDDGILIPHHDDLTPTTALTYSAWIKPIHDRALRKAMGRQSPSRARSQVSIIIQNSTINAYFVTQSGTKVLRGPTTRTGEWVHVAAAFNGTGARLYLNGIVVRSTSFTRTTLVALAQSFTIGSDASTPFRGAMDEVRVYSSALRTDDVISIMKQTHACVSGQMQFRINHSGGGSNCQSEPISVTALDLNGVLLDQYTGTIVLDTQTGTGTWTLASGSGTFNDATTNDGFATYTFSLADLGVATFDLNYSSGPLSFNIDVYDGPSRDDDSEGDLTFAPSAFIVTASQLPNPPPISIDDPIQTQIAGTPFDLHIAAFGTSATNSTCGIIEAYEATKPLRFWIDHRDPEIAPLVPTIDSKAISTSKGASVEQKVVFKFGQAVVSAKYKDTGRLTIHVLDDSSTNEVQGSTGAFVSQPAGFRVIAVANANGDVNPGVQIPSGRLFARAGEPFMVRVEVRDSEGSLTPSYGKESNAEGLRLTSSTLVAPAGGRNGTSNDGRIQNATAFSAVTPVGTFEGSTFAFDEVGAIRLQASVGDGDFLGSGNIIGTESGVVGRFAPSRFAVTSNTPRFATQCTIGAFTWMGQPFDYVPGEEAALTVSAVNLAGGITANYSGQWWRLTNDSLANRAYTSNTASIDETGLPGTNVDPSININDDGTGSLTFSTGNGLNLTRSTPISPFDAEIQLSIDILDEDNTSYPLNAFTIGGVGIGAGIPFNVSKRFQFGRLRLDNAHGSELVALPMALRTQRFNGTSFIDDDNDSCSSIPTSDLQLSATPSGLATTPTLGNVPLLTGNGALVFSAPNASGSVDIRVDLGVTGANLPWLRYDWPADGNLDGLLNDDPQARATFGIWEGREQLIYLREIY